MLIACASRFHPDYALAAVQAKKHVFVEKPAGVDVAGIQKILQADELSKKNGTGVLAGVTYRYHLGRREAIQRMQAGEIGEIVAIQCDYLRGPYRLIERQPEWSEMEYQFRNWYHFTWLCGDDIPQSLIHNLDSALWALGDVMPEQAYGMGGRSTHFQASMGTSFDHHHVTYEYADGRCIYGSCRTAVGCYGSNKDVFHGTKGRCHFAAFRPAVLHRPQRQPHLARGCRVVEEVALRAGAPGVSAIHPRGQTVSARQGSGRLDHGDRAGPNGGLFRPEDYLAGSPGLQVRLPAAGRDHDEHGAAGEAGPRRDLSRSHPRPNQAGVSAGDDLKAVRRSRLEPAFAVFPVHSSSKATSACVTLSSFARSILRSLRTGIPGIRPAGALIPRRPGFSSRFAGDHCDPDIMPQVHSQWV